MSSLIVEVCPIDEIRNHPNADRLDIAVVKGWQCVVPREKYRAGDLITYIPVDSVLTEEFATQLGVSKYLSNGRVRCAKLRGEPSFGIIADAFGEAGENVAEKLGVTKYVPPVRMSAGDAEVPHPLLDAYTDIENMRNFPSIFEPGEFVVATEKIHGTNSRIGVVMDDGALIRVAGSKGMRRKFAENSTYWMPWMVPGVKSLMEAVSIGKQQAILYGEVYGRVQSLRYGLPNALAYRAFDLKIDGKYVDADHFAALCDRYCVEQCPVLYRGPFDLAKIRELSDGRSMVPGADNIREGVVVRPLVERTNPTIGRVILKYVGDEYLLGGNDDQGE